MFDKLKIKKLMKIFSEIYEGTLEFCIFFNVLLTRVCSAV